jgi:protein TonB
MRKFTLLLLMILVFTCTFSRNVNDVIYFSYVITDTIPVGSSDQLKVEEKVYAKVETEASFQGGNEGWRNFLQANLNADVPVRKKAPAGLYQVVVQFIVDKEGRISDMKALTSHGFGMEQEVLRVIKRSPRWIPAVQDGRKVKAYRKQPISFSVTEK